MASSYASLITSRFGLEQAASALGASGAALPVIDNQVRVWFSPNQLDSWFMGITELLNIVTVFSILLPAAAMVREKNAARSSNCWSAPCRRSRLCSPRCWR